MDNTVIFFSTIIPVPFKMVAQQDHSHHERGGRRADWGSNQSQFPLPIFRDLYKLDQWFFAKFNKPVADSHFWLLFFLVITKMLDCALYLLVKATEKCRKGEERKRGDTSQKQLVILSPKLCQECALSGWQMPIKSAYQKPCRERRHGFEEKKKVEANSTKREEPFLDLSRGILPMNKTTS